MSDLEGDTRVNFIENLWNSSMKQQQWRLGTKGWKDSVC